MPTYPVLPPPKFPSSLVNKDFPSPNVPQNGTGNVAGSAILPSPYPSLPTPYLQNGGCPGMEGLAISGTVGVASSSSILQACSSVAPPPTLSHAPLSTPSTQVTPPVQTTPFASTTPPPLPQATPPNSTMPPDGTTPSKSATPSTSTVRPSFVVPQEAVLPASDPEASSPTVPHATPASKQHPSKQITLPHRNTNQQHKRVLQASHPSMITPTTSCKSKKKDQPIIEVPSTSESDSDSDSPVPSDPCINTKYKDHWWKTKEQAMQEKDWNLASKRTAFPIMIKKRGQGQKVIWNPMPFPELKELHTAAKEHGRGSHYFRQLLEATSAAHTLLPHDIRNVLGCILSDAEFLLWERQWKRQLATLASSYNHDDDKPDLILDQLAGEGEYIKLVD